MYWHETCLRVIVYYRMVIPHGNRYIPSLPDSVSETNHLHIHEKNITLVTPSTTRPAPRISPPTGELHYHSTPTHTCSFLHSRGHSPTHSRVGLGVVLRETSPRSRRFLISGILHTHSMIRSPRWWIPGQYLKVLLDSAEHATEKARLKMVTRIMARTIKEERHQMFQQEQALSP